LFFGLESLSGNCLVSRSGIVTERNPKQRQIDSDELQGVIQNPFAFYFLILRGFIGSIQTLPYDSTRMFSKEFDVQNERLLWNRNNLIQCLRGERSGAH